MNGGEKWRMIRCAGTAQDKMVINQIMLRFRPIAPKPASDASDSDLCSLNNKHLLLSKQRTKRKYVRVRKNNRFVKRNQNNKVSPSSSDQQKEKGKGTNILTLQLLPETSSYSTEEPLLDKERSRCNPDNKLFNNPSENNNQRLKLKQAVIDEAQPQTTAVLIPKRSTVVVVESWVTIECVTDTNQACMDFCTDVERLKNLEEDENPGFISDGSNKVKWVNEAYKKMMILTVMEEEEKSRAVEIMVRLVREEKLVPYKHKSAFTCWVRLSKEKELKEKNGSKMVPCDVWRMENGGLAWRLDVEAALSLGR